MSSQYIQKVLATEELLKYVSEVSWVMYSSYIKKSSEKRINSNLEALSYSRETEQMMEGYSGLIGGDRLKNQAYGYRDNLRTDNKNLEQTIRTIDKQKDAILKESEMSETLKLLQGIRKNLTQGKPRRQIITYHIHDIKTENGSKLTYDMTCEYVLSSEINRFSEFVGVQEPSTCRPGHQKVDWKLYKDTPYLSFFWKDLRLASDQSCGKVESKEIVYTYDPKKEESCVVM